MSPAPAIFPRTPPDVTVIFAARLFGDAFADPVGVGDSARNARLGSACAAALATHAAMHALSASVADISPNDPRHAAAYAASEVLQQRWRKQIARACRLPASGRSGLLAKAVLLSRLVDRDEADAVLGGPAAEVAASLADDILAASGLPGA